MSNNKDHRFELTQDELRILDAFRSLSRDEQLIFLGRIECAAEKENEAKQARTQIKISPRKK